MFLLYNIDVLWCRLSEQVTGEPSMLSKEEVIPTPHYFEPKTHDIALTGSIRIHVEAKDPKVLLAARLLKDGIEAQAPALRGSVRMGGDKAEINLHLVQWPGNFPF